MTRYINVEEKKNTYYQYLNKIFLTKKPTCVNDYKEF